jgi:hypothetical protein
MENGKKERERAAGRQKAIRKDRLFVEKEKRPQQPNGPKTAKARKRTDGLPRADFKKRNREIFAEIDRGDKQRLNTLIKAMKKNGVMLKDSITQDEPGINPVNTFTQKIHNINATNRAEPTAGFMQSLQTPGFHDVPYVDSSQVVPLPHGILTGNSLEYTVPVGNYFMMMVCPSMAFAIAPNLASQYAGFRGATYTGGVTPITPIDITDTPGSWAAYWGNTTAAQRIVPWSIAVDLVLRIPEAVVQGSFWVGNAPYRTIVAAPFGNLLQMSQSIVAERAGATYTVKASLLDRDLVHSPYGALNDDSTTPTIDYPGDERVSWIIFSPSSIGTISGTAPLSYSITATPRCNYLWVPAFQPLVIGTTAAQVEIDSRKILDPYKKAKLEVESNLEATNPIDPRCSMATWAPSFASMRNHALENEAMASNAFTALDPIASLRKYTTMETDIEYFLGTINQRWGSWSAYGDTIATMIGDACDKLAQLRLYLLDQDEQTDGILEDFKNGTVSVVWTRGLPRLKRTPLSGRDYDLQPKRSSSVESSFSKNLTQIRR